MFGVERSIRRRPRLCRDKLFVFFFLCVLLFKFAFQAHLTALRNSGRGEPPGPTFGICLSEKPLLQVSLPGLSLSALVKQRYDDDEIVIL